VLLMDEPASALDPIATQKIEELIYELKDRLHHRHRDAQHAAGGPGLRHTAFFYMGAWSSRASTDDIFTNPREEQTEAYITGRFG
jgi:phosphate transport system ATP-binding protein